MPLHYIKSAIKSGLILSIGLSFYVYADVPVKDIVDYRTEQEKLPANNPFGISLYKPTYVLPGYYSQYPYHAVYQNNTPEHEGIENVDFKFQLSLKVPVWHEVLGRGSDLYAGYTQLSYWQAYNDSAFFRETNYEPELFLANDINIPLLAGWRFKFLNLGVVHQSNGRGGSLERSWNRLYAEGIFAYSNWMVSIKPWFPVRDQSLKDYNKDITDYLGYERIIVAYKYNDQSFSLETRNTIESNFEKGMLQLAWAFPLGSKIKGYVQVFSGYGQSLIEYNHYTNGIGIGIALNDWI